MASGLKSMLAASLAVGGAFAAGVEDSLSLLQVAAQVYDENVPALQLTRTIATEQGSTMGFHLSPGCRLKDLHGDNNCFIPWKSKMTFNGSAKLKTPVRRGDSVKFNISLWFQAGNGAPELLRSLMTGDTLQGGFSCGICAGTCKMIANANSGFKAIVTTPTVLAIPEACTKFDQLMPTDIDLGSFEVPTPDAPLASWGIKTLVEVGGGIVSSNGTERVSENLRFKLMPVGMAPPAAQRTSLLSIGTDTSSAALAGTLGGLGLLANFGAIMGRSMKVEHEMQQRSLGMLGVLERAWSGAMVETIVQAAPRLLVQPKVGTTNIDSLNLKVTVTNPQTPLGVEPITLTVGGNCIKEQCKIPLGRSTTIAGKIHMNYSLTEGSYIVVNVDPTISGMMGKMAKPMMRPMLSMFPLKLQACGSEQINMKLMGQQIPYLPPPCGDYTFDIDAPAASLSLPDISNLKFSQLGVPRMPMMPDRVAELPGFDVKVNVDIYHKDGSLLFAVETQYGVGH